MGSAQRAGDGAVALSLVALIGASLFVRSLRNTGYIVGLTFRIWRLSRSTYHQG